MCFFNVEFHCSLNSNSMKKALFIDRDGIVNKKIPHDYVKKIEEFSFQDEILPILQWGKSRDYLLIMITNQQGIGKGISDAKAGKISGTHTILVGNYSAEQVPEADCIIKDLQDVLSILEHTKGQ